MRDGLELSHHSPIAANTITKDCSRLLGLRQGNWVLVYLVTLLAQNTDKIIYDITTRWSFLLFSSNTPDVPTEVPVVNLF